MTHVREQIRTAIGSALTGLPSLGSNVFYSRIYNLSETEVPAACIFFENEEIENISPARAQPALQRRKIKTSVVVVVNAEDGETENELDSVAEEIENKIFEDPTFNRLAVETSLVYAEKKIEEIDRPLGLMLLIFSSIVLTREGNAGQAIQQ